LKKKNGRLFEKADTALFRHSGESRNPEKNELLDPGLRRGDDFGDIMRKHQKQNTEYSRQNKEEKGSKP